MKVTILSHDVSQNGFSRAWLLARMLTQKYEVEIVGLDQDGGVWPPLSEITGSEVKVVSSSLRGMDGIRALAEIRSLVNGDVVYACKPHLGSYGAGLLKTIGTSVPLVLDLDDRDLSFRRIRGSLVLRYFADIPDLFDGNASYYLRLMEILCGLADAKTVTTPALKRRFGGRLLPQVCDTDLFNPSRFDQDRVRSNLDLPQDKTIVAFPGTPRRHKGLDNFETALSSLNRDDVEGIVVGAPEDELAQMRLTQNFGENTVYGSQPYREMPAWIAAADIVVVPQKANFEAARYQFPMKIVNAMAMEKPIITTDVSVLSSVVDGCGLVVGPNNPKEMVEAISKLSDDRELRETLGGRGRERCLKRYSIDANAPKVNNLIRKVSTR